MDLKPIQKKLGLTQQELAKRIGVARSQLSDIQRGARPISLKIAAKLARETGDAAILDHAIDSLDGA